MATKRQTANDYRKELHKLELDRMAIEKRIRNRFKELCKQNPDAFLTKAHAAQAKEMTEDEITRFNIPSLLRYIEYIEDELQKQHPHKQTEFNFSAIKDKLPNGGSILVVPKPVGERVIVSDGVAYTRKSEEDAMKCSKSPDGKHQFGFDGSTCSYCGTNVAYL
jgi:hypothetical protein